MSTNEWPRMEAPKGWYIATRMFLAVGQDDRGRTCLGPDTRMPTYLWVINAVLSVVALGFAAFCFSLTTPDVFWSIFVVLIGVVGIGGILLPPLLVRRHAHRAGPILRRGPGDDGYELPRLDRATRADQTCRLAEVKGEFVFSRSRHSKTWYRAFQIFLLIEDAGSVEEVLLYTGARAMPEGTRQRIQAELDLPIDTFSLGRGAAVQIKSAMRGL